MKGPEKRKVSSSKFSKSRSFGRWARIHTKDHVEKGIAYGFSVRDETEEISHYYLDQFQSEVAMFEGFMDSTSKLAQQVSDKGFKFLDFGLVRFCVGSTKTGLDTILVINSNTSKREGFKGLEEFLKYIDGMSKDEVRSSTEGLTDVLRNFNKVLEEIHSLRVELLKIMDKRKISSEHMDLDNLDFGVYLRTQDMLSMSNDERKKSLEKFVDSFTSNN